jgi:hypothetical protein
VSTESFLPPPPSESEGRVRFLGVFASAATEDAFRRRHFRDDRWLSSFLVIAAMLRVALFFLADYQELGLEAALWPLVAVRLLFLLVSGWTLFALRRAASPAAADRIFFGWCGLLAALTVCALSARPPGSTGLLLMGFAVVLVAYCVTPLPLSRQAILALTYTAGALFVSRQADAVTFVAAGATYAMSNLFGAVTSWQLNHRRRQMFLGALREMELRARLEEAMAEIRTLRGLLCVCGWCKRIRDEAETWQPMEVYVESRTHAEFTHGICPDCLHAQVREVAPSAQGGRSRPSLSRSEGQEQAEQHPRRNGAPALP